MTGTESRILRWLRTYSLRWDRVLANALNTGKIMSIDLHPVDNKCHIHARSKRGVDYRVWVKLHHITGEPVSFGRESVDAGQATS